MLVLRVVVGTKKNIESHISLHPNGATHFTFHTTIHIMIRQKAHIKQETLRKFKLTRSALFKLPLRENSANRLNVSSLSHHSSPAAVWSKYGIVEATVQSTSGADVAVNYIYDDINLLSTDNKHRSSRDRNNHQEVIQIQTNNRSSINMLKRSHFFPLLFATSPLVVTTITVDTYPQEDVVQHHHHYHLRHSAQQQQQVFVVGRMRNNQPTTTVVMNQRQQHQQRRALGKSSKSKSQKAKSSKHSRDDGYHHYSSSYDDGDNLVASGDFANQYGMHDNGGEAEGDNDEDVAAPVQAGISFDILFDNNNNNNNNADSSSSSAMTEDGDAIQGEGSDAEALEFSSFNDRIDNEEEGGGGGSASTLATSTNQEVSTESIDGFPTTTTPNSTNIEVLKKWEIKPSGRTSAIAAAGVISLVSLGSVFFVTVGLIIHAKQSKRAAAVAGAAANNNNSVEDSSVDASIWSANEGGGEDFIGDIAGGGGGGEPMPMASPQPAGVSSIAAMGMASPLALQLSGRSGAGAFTFE
eukprot:scaffold39186_cov134-Skeletonema_marinoi.AAC.2